MIPEIRIEEFNYILPDEKIAKYPLPKRDSSKLLIYRDEKVSESSFSLLPGELPEDSLMIFNDTKVVPARLHFQRETGAHIEIFCLEPVLPQGLKVALTQKIDLPELAHQDILPQHPLQIHMLPGQYFLETDDIGHFRLNLLKNHTDPVGKVIDAVDLGIWHIAQIIGYNFHFHMLFLPN